MSNTPSDPDYINTKALEGFMRAFDRALTGKYDLSGGAMVPVPTPNTVASPGPNTPTMIECREGAQTSFWHWFPPTRIILRFRDNIRLRKYNREWIKNNIH